jgi:hypothetical protein
MELFCQLNVFFHHIFPSYASKGLGYGQTFQKLELFYCQNRLKSIESIKEAPPEEEGAFGNF